MPAAGVIIGCCNLVERDGSYLLVREGKPSARGRFNLPAGKPEIGETLIEAAVREAKEESGLDVTVDHIVGLYHCPENDEGFGVLNVVFGSSVTGGEIVTSDAHPEVRYFTRAEVADLSARHLLRGSHIELAMDTHALGQRLPLDLVRVTDHEPGRLLRPESRQPRHNCRSGTPLDRLHLRRHSLAVKRPPPGAVRCASQRPLSPSSLLAVRDEGGTPRGGRRRWPRRARGGREPR